MRPNTSAVGLCVLMTTSLILMIIAVAMFSLNIYDSLTIENEYSVGTISGCPTEINGKTYANLPLLTNSGPYNGDWQMVDQEGEGLNWNICAPQNLCPSSCGISGTVVCMNCMTSPKSLGILETQMIEIVPGVNSVNFIYASGSFSSGCGVNYASNISVACTTSQDTTLISTVREVNCRFSILMRSPYACEGYVFKPTYPLVPEHTFVLSEMKKSWGREMGWVSDPIDGCFWKGVKCNTAGAYSVVTEIDISRSNVSSPIPDSIGMLSTLTHFNASHTNITGKLPVGFANILSLKSLDVSHANLLGTIPPEVFAKPRYETLYLQSNRFTGPVDMSVCTINRFNAQDNRFDCPLPWCCGTKGDYMCYPCNSFNSSKY